MRSVKSSSNQREDSYYEIKNDGSKEYRQIKVQKISTSKLVNKQSGTRQPADKDSNLREGSQVNNSTMFEKVNREVTEATSDNTVKLEDTRVYIRNEVGTTHIKTDKSIVDVIEISNHDGKQFVDDPRKGARTLENNLVYSGSSTLLGNEIY